MRCLKLEKTLLFYSLRTLIYFRDILQRIFIGIRFPYMIHLSDRISQCKA